MAHKLFPQAKPQSHLQGLTTQAVHYGKAQVILQHMNGFLTPLLPQQYCLR